MSDDGAPEEEVEEGAPSWMATFADLMSLLMCFFVLLLSFSEIDMQKYKQVAGSMSDAFGVQRDIPADQIPKADSVVKQEFAPGKPEFTPIRTVRQNTHEDRMKQPRLSAAKLMDPLQVERLQERLRQALQEEIDTGIIEMLNEDYGVKVRVRDKDAFPSGSARLQAEFMLVLDKLAGALGTEDGRVVVSGHTDDVPIDTAVYPSNWVLSSARAASVVHYLAEGELSDPDRIEIRAYAESRPLVPNDTPENRAKNRRVEIDVALGY